MSSSSDSRPIPRWAAWEAIAVVMAGLQFGQDTIKSLFQSPQQKRVEQARQKREEEFARELLQKPLETQRTFDEIDEAGRAASGNR